MPDEDGVISAIKACLGDKAATYAANKHRGGTNGAKGTRYEDFFLAVRVAEAVASVVDNPRAEWPHVRGQCYGFVDDARVATSTHTEYYQLKNKEMVNWTTGAHSIAADFEFQYKLAIYLKEPTPTTGLVVSTKAQHQSLLGSVPASIAPHSSVYYFPWLSTPNRLVLESPDLQKCLKKLAKVEEPTLDVLSGVFGLLLIACIEYPDGASVEEIVARACRLIPGQLRRLPATEDWEQQLTQPFRLVLSQIRGLSYGANRGYFHWAAFGTSGVFGWDCTSKEFTEFQELIIKNAPKTFEEFEQLLP
jgi:hypothetical protein